MRVRATLKIRNAVAIEAREKLGLSQRALAEALGLAWMDVCSIENLNFARRGLSEVKLQAIALFLGVSEFDLMPVAMRGKKWLDRMTVSTEIPESRMLELRGGAKMIAQAPEAPLEAEDMRRTIDECLGGLRDGQKAALTMHYGLDGYGERDIREISETLGVSYERARQIILSGINHLRHPQQAKRLGEYVGIDPDDRNR